MEEFWADRKASFFSVRTGGWSFEVSGVLGKGPPAEYFAPLGFGLSCRLFDFFRQLHYCQCRGNRNVALVFWLLPLRSLCDQGYKDNRLVTDYFSSWTACRRLHSFVCSVANSLTRAILEHLKLWTNFSWNFIFTLMKVYFLQAALCSWRAFYYFWDIEVWWDLFRVHGLFGTSSALWSGLSVSRFCSATF